MEEFYANGILPTFNVNSQEHLEKISSFNKYNSICIKKHFILEKEDTIFLSEYKAYHNFFLKYPVIKAILYIDSEEQKVIHNSKDFSFYSFPMPVYSIKGIVSVKIFSEKLFGQMFTQKRVATKFCVRNGKSPDFWKSQFSNKNVGL